MFVFPQLPPGYGTGERQNCAVYLETPDRPICWRRLGRTWRAGQLVSLAPWMQYGRRHFSPLSTLCVGTLCRSCDLYCFFDRQSIGQTRGPQLPVMAAGMLWVATNLVNPVDSGVLIVREAHL